MNIALTMDAGQIFGNEGPPEGALAFLASRSKKSARQVSAPASEVFKGITDAIDQMLLSVIEARTEAEFRHAQDSAFPKYVAIALAVSSFAHVMVPPDVVNRLARETINELEAEIREKALAAFGADIRDQVLFTVWTLRKISDLLTQISTVKVGPSKQEQEEDRKYSQMFVTYALRAHFSLDCLNMALRVGSPIYPDVMAGLKEGLRSMVNAYAWVRQGAALRMPVEDPAMEPIVSDEDDDELLHSSMQDMAFVLAADESE
jgi:hypothetical protein